MEISKEEKQVMDKVAKMVCEVTGEHYEHLSFSSHGSAMDAKSIIAKILDIEEISMSKVGLYLFKNVQKARYALNRFYQNKSHYMLNNYFEKCINIQYEKNLKP